MSWKPPRHDPALELREHLSEDGWCAAVRAICARHGFADAELAPFASGSDVVWSAGERVVKLTAPRWSDEIRAEVRCLELVAGRLAVRTPEPLAHGELEGWPYVVLERLPGVALGSVWWGLDAAERERLAAALGRLARELHALELEEEPDDGWEEFWRACRAGVARRHAGPEVPPELADEVLPFLDSVGALECEPRALLHTELLDEHVLIERSSGRPEISGLIDFADGRYGPPAYEFPAPVEFVFRGQPGLFRAFLIAYGYAPSELTPAFAERMLAWGLSHRFGNLARMLRAVAPWRPASLPELAQRLYGVA